MTWLLALDQGTTSSRAILFHDERGAVAAAQRELPQDFPQPGWVEHDANRIWHDQCAVIEEVLAAGGVAPHEVAALGITNQRETTVLWDRATGRPIHNALVWQDRRTAAHCERLCAAGHEATIRQKTGLLLDPYFSATKLHWLLENVPGARARAEAGELAFGTIDAWLVWMLTGGAVHATDVSNASRTMLCNLHTGDWDDDLLALFDIPRALLPTIVPSSGVLGEAHHGAPGVPIAGMAGDQQAALFGQACFERGQAKNTFGTGCFLLCNTGTSPVLSENRLVTTIAWKIGEEVTYALEGSVFMGGALVQWLRDGLGLIESASEVEALASQVDDSGGVCLVPAFTGLGAPHWDPSARGTLLGLTRGTTGAHIARAALEAIALQVADVATAMAADIGSPIQELRVDGGAAASDLLLQIQADVANLPVLRPRGTEASAQGAAFLAGLAVGVWDDPAAIAATWKLDRRIDPAGDPTQLAALRAMWARGVERSKGWLDPA